MAAKTYDEDVEFRLARIIEHGLLEPIPGFIERTGQRIKINRPPSTLRKPEKYEKWKADHGSALPAWVHEVTDPDIFYFKLWDLADIVEVMDITQEMSNFVSRYDEGRKKLEKK